MSTSNASGPAITASDLTRNSVAPQTSHTAIVELNNIQPSTVVNHEIEVEEHATPSGGLRAESENLSRSQLTAVHDIPANTTTSAIQQSTSRPILSASNTDQSNFRNNVQNRVQSSNVNIGASTSSSNLSSVAREALEETIACLSDQLKDASRKLESFNLSSNVNFGAPTSYIELIDVVTKLSQSLSAAADAYKRFDEI